VLRAIRRGGSRWQPEIHLDISDVRTLRRLERRAGLAGLTGGAGPTIEQFLQRQRLIPLNSSALIALRSLLADGGVGPEWARLAGGDAVNASNGGLGLQPAVAQPRLAQRCRDLFS